MARPRKMTPEQAADLARSLPRLIGRQATPRDIAKLLGVSPPCAAKYLKLAASAGLLEGPQPSEPTDAEVPNATPEAATE